MKQPTITVVIATYQSEVTIGLCLKSIREQKYNQKKIDIILCDGGSKDNTFKIAKKYNVKVLKIPPRKQNAEYNKAVGISKATGELLLLVDHDNVLPHSDWITNMVRPLIKHKHVIGVETLRYHYDPDNSILDRYFALFGAGDPLAYYLGKADRASYIDDTYALRGSALDHGKYYLVKFTSDNVTTLGANGFMIRRRKLLKHADASPQSYFHIDVNVDLIKKGYDTFAFTKDTVIHLTGYKDISMFLYRRKLFMEQYYMQPISNRRYSVYTPSDKWKLLLFILWSITIVKPLYDAHRGYRKLPDTAWFLHPYLCLALVLIYGSVIISAKVKYYVNKLF